MKIAYIINNATYTSIPIEWASKLSAYDDVTIISLYDSQDRIESVCRKIAPNCKMIGLNFKKHCFKAVKHLLLILKRDRYQIVHTHQTFSGSLVRFILRKNEKIKIVHTVHANHHSFSKKQNIIIGSTLQYCDAIVFNSVSTKKGLLSWQKKRTENIHKEVIYNGIDVKRIQNASAVSEKNLCSKYEIENDDFVFAQIGRLEAVKNPLCSLKAFKREISEYPNRKQKLLLIGDGSMRNDVELYIRENDDLKDKVIMTGTLQRDDVYSMMKRINAVIVPSIYEGFCNALFESLSAGISIIVSDIDVFAELLEKSLEIKSFSVNSDEELALCMDAVYNDTVSELTRAKRQAIAYDKYDISKCIDKYRKLYSFLVNGGQYATHS